MRSVGGFICKNRWIQKLYCHVFSQNEILFHVEPPQIKLKNYKISKKRHIPRNDVRTQKSKINIWFR